MQIDTTCFIFTQQLIEKDHRTHTFQSEATLDHNLGKLREASNMCVWGFSWTNRGAPSTFLKIVFIDYFGIENYGLK
jgi:hypothetical protein